MFYKKIIINEEFIFTKAERWKILSNYKKINPERNGPGTTAKEFIENIVRTDKSGVREWDFSAFRANIVDSIASVPENPKLMQLRTIIEGFSRELEMVKANASYESKEYFSICGRAVSIKDTPLRIIDRNRCKRSRIIPEFFNSLKIYLNGKSPIIVTEENDYGPETIEIDNYGNRLGLRYILVFSYGDLITHDIFRSLMIPLDINNVVYQIINKKTSNVISAGTLRRTKDLVGEHIALDDIMGYFSKK